MKMGFMDDAGTVGKRNIGGRKPVSYNGETEAQFA
jgi:hypothetical protein